MARTINVINFCDCTNTLNGVYNIVTNFLANPLKATFVDASNRRVRVEWIELKRIDSDENRCSCRTIARHFFF